ncbi:hypothetical protein EMCG_06883 [[Emmonsia] crescens]|uniref:Uncharacterized protein n=1 Tax=[Emmonsia] crescens TaxID=73230 RepID=A0A0G2I9Y0_9EURO|nr:hypothetical protein EMCG_06883 [Emmonsia crescens UAMH 3008]
MTRTTEDGIQVAHWLQGLGLARRTLSLPRPEEVKHGLRVSLRSRGLCVKVAKAALGVARQLALTLKWILHPQISDNLSGLEAAQFQARGKALLVWVPTNSAVPNTSIEPGVLKGIFI